MNKSIIALVIGMFWSLACIAQDLNADSMLQKAKVFSEQHDYNAAITITKKLVDRYPGNSDYTIMLGRIYSWKGDYTNAANTLRPLTEKGGASTETFEALTNAYLWAKQYDSALLYTDQGLGQFPGNPTLTLNKALLLSETGKEKQALQLLHGLNDSLHNDPKYRSVYTFLMRKKKSMVSVYYLNTSFSNPGFTPWHLAYIEYKHNFKASPVIARINYGNLFNNSAFQFEAEAYPKLTKHTYLFVNLGLAGGKAVFPDIKSALELYTGWESWTGSIGGRFLNFKPDPVYIITGHLGYQVKSWHVLYRPFITRSLNDWSVSHGVSIKRSNEAKESFVQFDFQYGVIPFVFFTTNDVSRVNAIRFGIQYRFRIAERFFLHPAFMYEREEYYPELFRNRYNTQIGLSVRL